MGLAPGTSIGHYNVTSLLGEGGMGQVWQATDTQLNREVALKILPDAFASDPDRLARFQREAQILASLNHPNIAAIYGIEEAEGTRALVLELVEGPTLADRISKGPIPLDEALPIAKQIAEALEAAHEAGVIHRDLKPANIKVREDGTVKVLDFGLAKALDTSPEGGPTESPTLTAAATQMGVVMGTAAYMSPEQAEGRRLDERSDIFSFGAVLYEVVSGHRAFDGDTTVRVLSSVLRDEPRALDAPSALERVVRLCLRKPRGERYGSMSEVRVALEATGLEESRPSIAVLPFANMSADPENEYFCDGIAEEITNALAKVDRLDVAGRTSAFSFKGKTGDLRETGRALNVSTVLEGSVRKAGVRLRITAKLVKVSDGYHLWSERYDRQLEDIFEIQDEIALAVVEALKVTLLGEEKAAVLKRSTDSPEAYRLCLKAHHAWTRWTDEGFRTAISLYEQAVEKDSNYALAHWALGHCYASWAILGREPADLRTMRTHLETAIRLDQDQADAHAVLGAIVEGVVEWNWPPAESGCQKAIALNPRSAHVRNVYGVLLGVLGRHEESIAMFRRAIELDPLGPLWNACLIQALLGNRDWDGALQQTRATLDVAPDYWYALQLAGQAHAASGQLDEAISTFERAVRASAEVPYTIGLLGNSLARAGRRDEASQQLEKLRARAESHYVPAVALAYVHAGLDQLDEAFSLLERALDAHDFWLTYSLTVFPALDDLRPDPRFTELVRRIGL